MFFPPYFYSINERQIRCEVELSNEVLAVFLPCSGWHPKDKTASTFVCVALVLLLWAATGITKSGENQGPMMIHR